MFLILFSSCFNAVYVIEFKIKATVNNFEKIFIFMGK